MGETDSFFRLPETSRLSLLGILFPLPERITSLCSPRDFSNLTISYAVWFGLVWFSPLKSHRSLFIYLSTNNTTIKIIYNFNKRF